MARTLTEEKYILNALHLITALDRNKGQNVVIISQKSIQFFS